MSQKLDIDKTRLLLQEFKFSALFREELGWSSPKSSHGREETIKEIYFLRQPIAELSGAIVFEVVLKSGELPNHYERKEISKYVKGLHFENVCIFLDKQRSQSIWHWEKKQEKKMLTREHFFMRGQPGDLFIGKLSSLVVDLGDFDREGNIPIVEVAARMKEALDVEVVTKKFYKNYQEEFNGFLENIQGIPDENDRKWYASVILNRLMFIYFLQRKFFLDNGDIEYLSTKLEFSKAHLGKDKYYNEFLKKLFFEGFAKEEKDRSEETNQQIGKIKYLNGGLFLLHKIEKKYNGQIKIKDIAFENLYKLFKSYSWNLNDSPGGQDNELNPDVLGYIFEKYINQKAFGAYYTRPEITEYLCEQTIYNLILDAVNGEHVDTELLKRAKIPARKKYERIEDLLIGLDESICSKLVVGNNAILPNLSLLDPACGSGAFLVAAMKTLINVYAAILGKIKFLGSNQLTSWLAEIEKSHPSVNYYIKKQIISNNLFGVDIMEEASEIAKLRLFLALVASAQKVEDLEPLPNIDFNIMCGNSLIGLMRVDEKLYNQHQKGDMFRKSYNELVHQREAAIRAFRSFEGNREMLQLKKEAIDRLESEANGTLNLILGQQFHNLGVKYERQIWDERKKEIGKPIKKNITVKDIEELTPFHWGYEFSEIFRKKNGFDAIITNPPWEIFKPNAKEFFASYSNVVSKKKMNIKDFEKEQEKLLVDVDTRDAWLDYLSKFPHLSSFYRNSPDYKNQISVVAGKKAGSDINLYKLFTEQCYNLLKKGGYCGIIIPTGIYTDLGAKQLRQLLFENCSVKQLVSFANEKFLFEGVDHRFKFCFLSFQKGDATKNFKATFRINPRECIAPEDLESFLHDKDNFLDIPVDFIYSQSPESLSVMEIRNPIDFQITKKLLNFPTLGEELNGAWQVSFGSEFHMTNDSQLFSTRTGNNSLPLFEGKMINQYVSNANGARFWVNASKGRTALLGKRGDDGESLGYEKYRIAFRSIARNTDSRTMISTIIPPSFTGNSITVSENLSYKLQCYLIGIFNSFVFDWFLRQQVSANINMFYIYQMRVPRLPESDLILGLIVQRVADLLSTNENFLPFIEKVIGKRGKEYFLFNEIEKQKIKAEIDALVAHLYGINHEELTYILRFFPVVPEEYKALTIEAYANVVDILPMRLRPIPDYIRELIKRGENKKLEYKSTLCVDLKDGTKKYGIEHSVLKTIAAFLNSEGGTLLLGVTDDGSVNGLEDDFRVLGSKGDPRDNFNKAFDNLISNNFGRNIHRLIDLSLEPIDGKVIAKVEVKEKSPEEVFLVNKEKNSIEEFYVRLNASSVALSGKELSKYIKEHWK